MAVSATRPSHNRDNPLPHKLVLVDEYAMVHEGLHRDLMDALGRGSKLIVFGDVDQLPPIEEHELKSLSGEPYKSPFERLLNTRSAVVLDTVYRQSEGSGILHNATLIRNGKSPVRRDDFKIVVTDTPLKWIRDFANETTLDLADTKNQVILPVKVTDIGTHKVNTILQSVLNPAALRGLALPRYKHEEKYPLSVSVGDKVLCTENMYDMRDYFQRYERWQNDITPVHSSFIPCPDNFQMLNGEIGIITDITEDDGLVVDFGDRWVTIPPSFRDVNQYKRMVNVDPRKRISLGYAITVHKSQGSEFDNVVYMQHSVCSFMLSRNLVYTAVTRARDLVYYVTDSRQYNNSVRLTAKEKMINMLRNKK